MTTGRRFTLERRRWGHLFTLARLIAVLALWLPLPAAIVAGGWYGRLVLANPAPAVIDRPIGEIPSTIVSAHGFVIGGLERGRREWTRYDDISPAFVRAALAAEDSRFFSHEGFDIRGLARALVANRHAGRTAQGGSSITQQLAKSFVGTERTLSRKLSELVVARRIEANFSKTEIFEAWANRAYFGAGATGVEAAAQTFFGITARDLTLAQAALVASVIPAPGRLDPRSDPAGALERRNRILGRMDDLGLAGADEVAVAIIEPITLRSAREDRVSAPSVERAVWRELSRIDDNFDWRNGALRVETSIDLVRQRSAENAVRTALFALDQRQGRRGSLAWVEPAGLDAFDAAIDVTASDEFGLARVVAVTPDSVVVRARGGERTLEQAAWQWAVNYREDADNHGETIESPVGVFSAGEVVVVHRDLGIVQLPRTEAAWGEIDLADGAVEAMVGGFDSARSDFDRFDQACRQPGSTFKPIVYSAALERGYTPASMLSDVPVRITLGPQEEWRPRNADGSFDGRQTLYDAFVHSRNLPLVGVFRDLGAQRVIRQARALGVTSPMDAVESLGLGASCMSPRELLAVYAVFARSGFAVNPFVVAAASRADGSDLVARDTWRINAEPLDRVEGLWRERAAVPVTVVDPAGAWQIAWLMRAAVLSGTASRARENVFEIAGKTGTTTAFDALFAGFSSRSVAVSWVGTDRNTRPLGRHETGGELALPLFADALLGPPWPETLLAPPREDIEWALIDRDTGLLAAPGDPGIEMPFRRGTQPVDFATPRVVRDVMQIDRTTTGF